MTTLGVSVYPDIRPLDEIAEYLRLASRYGFTRVFTSMFSVEGTNEEVLAYFRDLDAIAHVAPGDLEEHMHRLAGGVG